MIGRDIAITREMWRDLARGAICMMRFDAKQNAGECAFYLRRCECADFNGELINWPFDGETIAVHCLDMRRILIDE